MAKLPAKLYITSIGQGENEARLGFLNAYEPGKAAFEKKKLTQEAWAYQRNLVNFKIEVQCNDTYLVGEKYEYNFNLPYNDPGRAIRVPYVELLEHPPIIWDNTPMTGFKIENSVSRYSTSNKLWRILDPRGIEFEISTACLETIINNAGILKGGVIDAKCAWMSNKNLVVVP